MSNNNKNTFSRIIFCGIFLASSVQLVNAASFEARNDKKTAYISIGQTTVKANELVYGQPSTYPADYKLSQLIWDVRNVPVLTAGVNVFFDKRSSFNIEGKFGIADTRGVMDDYDWQYTGRDWSDWSHHEDTALTELSSIDVNLNFNLIGKKKATLSLLLGYKEDVWAWKSHGGTYIYSDIDNGGFRDQRGSFTPGRHVISYEQRFSMPYIGVKFDTLLNNWKFNLQYKYSDQVDVKATDHHVLRNLIFEDEFDKGKMSAYKIGIAYQISKHFDVHVLYDVQVQEEVRGNTIYKNSSTGAITGGCVNCAGADNSNQTLSVGTTYLY